MWVSPNHPDRERLTRTSTAEQPRPEPPRETGRILAQVERKNRDRPPEMLRVTLDAFQGRPYLSVRLWYLDQDGAYRPSRKGLSVRLHEAEAVAAALTEALALVEQSDVRTGADPLEASRDHRPDRERFDRGTHVDDRGSRG